MDAASFAHAVEKLLPAVSLALPSILVASTNYPKASRALRAVSHVLQFFSILSHKDCPGTLKAPGHVDRPSEGPVEDEPAVRERPEPEAQDSKEPSEEGSSEPSEVAFLRGLVRHFLGIADGPEKRRR